MPQSVPDSPANRLERYYPGADYVDVLALDGYNWGASHPGVRRLAVASSEVFGAGYDRLRALGPQPIWIAEVGSAPRGRRQGRVGARHVGDRPHAGRA